MTPSASKQHPWPCERCGHGVAMHPKAGRLPLGAGLALTLFLVFLGLGLRHWSVVTYQWWLLMPVFPLLAALSLHRRNEEAWRCPHCQLTMRARALPSTPPSVMVAVPTYNNAKSIEAVLRDIHQHAPGMPLLVVNDGSTDNTGALVEKVLRELYDNQPAWVLHHPKNLGKGAAIRRALTHALEHDFSHVITLDGDGQHFARNVFALRQTLQEHPDAIVVGARDLGGEHVGTSSRFGRAFSNFWLKVQTGVSLQDSQSGYRAYPTAPVLSLGANKNRYDFEVEVLTLGARAGMPLVSVPIDVFYPPPSERVSHFDKLWDNVRISWLNTRLLFFALLWPLGHPGKLSKRPPPPPIERDWDATSRGGAFGHLFFFTLLKWVGKKPALLMLYPVVFYFVLFASKARKASGAFLDIATGETARGWRRFWRSYWHILEFARAILDRALVRVRGPGSVAFRSEGYDGVQRALQDGRGVLFLSAHLGNYELGGMLFDHAHGVPVNVVMLDNEAAAIKRVQQRFGKSEHFKIIATNRSSFPALRILHALRQGEIVALHGDRVINKDWQPAEFFGRPAPFPTGIFAIAAAAKAPVMLTFGLKEAGMYRFVAEPPRAIDLPRGRRDAALAEHVQWYAARLESYARRYPYQWFNFYDFWQTPSLGDGA